MKRRLSLGVIAITASLAFAGAAQAQFGGLGGLVGGSKSGSANAGADLGPQQDQLSRTYVAAGKDVLTANDHFADALGIKAQVVNATATADSISAKNIEDQDKAISANAAAISDAMKAGATLKDGEAKAKYVKGLVSLAVALKKYKDMGPAAQSFGSSLSSASPTMLPKLQAGAYIVKSLPSSVTNLSNSLKSAIDFAKSNGVEVPADATSVL
jgi:hypothetical protein